MSLCPWWTKSVVTFTRYWLENLELLRPLTSDEFNNTSSKICYKIFSNKYCSEIYQLFNYWYNQCGNIVNIHGSFYYKQNASRKEKM